MGPEIALGLLVLVVLGGSIGAWMYASHGMDSESQIRTFAKYKTQSEIAARQDLAERIAKEVAKELRKQQESKL